MNPRTPSPFVVCLAVISSLAFILLAAAAETATPPSRIPAIAEIAGIKVGYTTREQVEARWGKGLAMTGGHPNGARVWRVKGTSWVIYADAFDYSKQGTVLNRLDLSAERKPDQRAPFARVTTKELVWLGGIHLGMPEEQVLAVLKRHSLTTRKVERGIEASAPGFYRVNQQETYELWTAELRFSTNALSWFSLGAQVKPRTN